MIHCLIGADRAGGGHRVDGVVPVGLVAEEEGKAGLHDLVGGGGIGIHALGLIDKVVFRTDFPHRGGQHIGPQVFHAAALVKKDLQAIGEFRLAGTGRGGGLSLSSGLLRRLLTAGANLLDQSINFLQQGVDIFSKGLLVFDVLQLLTEKVNGLKQ